MTSMVTSRKVFSQLTLPKSSDPFVYFLTLILAACSILYELTIAQSMALLAANTVVWYSVTVGLYLLGMGVGSFVSKHLMRWFGPQQPLISVELLLTLVGASVVLLIHAAHMLFLFFYSFGAVLIGSVIFFGSAFCLTLLVGFLTGIELPLLMKAAGDDDLAVTNSVLGIDYVGSLVGAVIFPIFLLPNFELLTISFGVAAVNLVAAGVLILRSRWSSVVTLAEGLCFVALAGGAFYLFSQNAFLQQYFLKKYYYYYEASDTLSTMFAPMEDFPDIIRYSSPYQKIDLMQDQADELDYEVIKAFSAKLAHDPEYPRKHMLFLNGDFQLNTSLDEIYHEYFAHVPIVLNGTVPKKVLVLGGGDGLLVRELLKHKNLHIQHRDLDYVLVDVASHTDTFLAMNKGAFLDDRVDTKLGDGYYFARVGQDQFDAIYIDFSLPTDYNLAKLYSREFFHFIRERLAPNGYAVFDASGIGLVSDPDQNGNQEVIEGFNDWPYYYYTLRAAGFAPDEIVPYLTTLEFENPNVGRMLRSGELTTAVAPEVAALLNLAETPQERAMLTNMVYRAAKDDVVTQFVVGLQQGFVMMTKNPEHLTRTYWDMGIPLYVLNRKRFDLAFNVVFPKDRDIKWKFVNSIMRPTFPTTSIWDARTPF